MPLPEVYRKSPEVVQSFNFEDIANGLGYSIFFGLAQKNTSETTFHLVQEIDYSSVKGTSVGKNASVERNFDTSTFNLPRTVSGDAYVIICGEKNVADMTTTIAVQFFKVAADNTETALSSEFSFTDAGDNIPVINFFSVPLTETAINRGERIRLEVTMTNNNSIDAAATGAFGHDPKDRTFPFSASSIDTTDANATTVLKVEIPFKIEQ